MPPSCKVGDDYSEEDIANDYGNGKWYLNTALKASCSGSIDKYKVKFYENNLDEVIYHITLAIWTPMNSMTYQKVQIYILH